MSTPITRMTRLALASAIALVAGCAAAPRVDTAAFPEARYRAHIERLASDEFAGRAPGTAGERKTVAYIEQQFRAAGLEPAFGDSFVQALPVIEIRPQADAAMQLRGTQGPS